MEMSDLRTDSNVIFFRLIDSNMFLWLRVCYY